MTATPFPATAAALVDADDEPLTSAQRAEVVERLVADLVESACRMSSWLREIARDGFEGFAQRSDAELLKAYAEAFDEPFAARQ